MQIVIDNKVCECEKGEFLLEIARRNGIFIPSLCHHQGLPGQGCCRVCIVEVEERGWSKVVTSCCYPVERESRVLTMSEKIKKQRAMVLALLHARAPESETVSRMCAFFGVAEYPRFMRNAGEKCILCGLCAKACQSLGTGAIASVNRGVEKRIDSPYAEPPQDCVGCLSCASICPTGAIVFGEEARCRKIWGREFMLLFCERCGEMIGTREEVALSAAKSGGEPARLCAACKKKTSADVMASVYGKTAL